MSPELKGTTTVKIISRDITGEREGQRESDELQRLTEDRRRSELQDRFGRLACLLQMLAMIALCRASS